jgi:hypothetical protein
MEENSFFITLGAKGTSFIRMEGRGGREGVERPRNADDYGIKGM